MWHEAREQITVTCRLRNGLKLAVVSVAAAIGAIALTGQSPVLAQQQTAAVPSDNPLWQHPKVLITPHVSGTTDGFWARETQLIADNVARYLGGRPLRNVVDRTAGY